MPRIIQRATGKSNREKAGAAGLGPAKISCSGTFVFGGAYVA